MLTETHKLTISNGMNRFFDNGGKNGMLGKHTSDYQKKRVSETHLGIPLSEEHKRKLSSSRICKPLSEEHVKSLKIAQRKRFDNGDIIWSKGKKFTKEHRDNLSSSHIGKISRKRICHLDSRREYAYLHNWIKRNLPKLECEHCGCFDKLEYANKSGLYKKEIDDWFILCKKCHAKYDQSFTEEEILVGRVQKL